MAAKIEETDKCDLAGLLADTLIMKDDAPYEQLRYGIVHYYGYDEFREIQKQAFQIIGQENET